MREMGMLGKDDIEVRIGEIKSFKGGNGSVTKYVTLLLYKTARVDMKVLDEKFGQFGWQNEYKDIDGKMYAGISVYNKETAEWITKWNVGTESNIEAAKGEASDAFKRAGYLWGIGTELYSSPKIAVYEPFVNVYEEDSKGVKKNRCNDSFSVRKIQYYENGDIATLVIWNDTKGCECFKYENGKKMKLDVPAKVETSAKVEVPEKKAESTDKPSLVCEDCGVVITQAVYKYSMDKFGRALCVPCQKK